MPKLFELSDIGLTNEQKQILSKRFELLMGKYQLFERNATSKKSKDYFAGVGDGLNTSWKILNGIEDDYLFE